METMELLNQVAKFDVSLPNLLVRTALTLSIEIRGPHFFSFPNFMLGFGPGGVLLVY